jgi:serine/threonine protein kinase
MIDCKGRKDIHAKIFTMMRELKLEQSLVDNRYEITERLSHGSFAEIYVARDRQSGGMQVVIKALNPSLRGTPDADLERTLIENFQNEAMALDAVRHPNVILRLGHGTAADLRGTPFHYLVLEYMPGGDLLTLCRRRQGNSLKLDEALFFFRQVCEGLAYAHSRGIIHRDLKPNNFLLSADQRIVKIADFGVAKITAEGGEDAEVTRVGAQVYAPPEHHPERQTQSIPLTESADTYSLAKSFYTVVVGSPPRQFTCGPILALPDELMAQPWGAALARVLRRATEEKPADRYATVVEFWSDLASVASADSLASVADERTLVRPRLVVSPGSLPDSPAQPEFDSTLTPEPVVREPELQVAKERAAERWVDQFKTDELPLPPRPPVRVVIDLPGAKPDDQIAAGRASAAAPSTAAPGDVPVRRGARPVERRRAVPTDLPAARGFREQLWQGRKRIILVVVAVILALATVYLVVGRYASSRGYPIGFGPPTEVEVTTQALRVRSGPSMNDRTMGIVLRGTRHRVVTAQTAPAPSGAPVSASANGWIQIEVGEWDEASPHDQSTLAVRGWVYADPDYVRVVSRRFLR